MKCYVGIFRISRRRGSLLVGWVGCWIRDIHIYIYVYTAAQPSKSGPSESHDNDSSEISLELGLPGYQHLFLKQVGGTHGITRSA